MHRIHVDEDRILAKCTECMLMRTGSLPNAPNPCWWGQDPCQMHWIHVNADRILAKCTESMLMRTGSLQKAPMCRSKAVIQFTKVSFSPEKWWFTLRVGPRNGMFMLPSIIKMDHAYRMTVPCQKLGIYIECVHLIWKVGIYTEGRSTKLSFLPEKWVFTPRVSSRKCHFHLKSDDLHRG